MKYPTIMVYMSRYEVPKWVLKKTNETSGKKVDVLPSKNQALSECHTHLSKLKHC